MLKLSRKIDDLIDSLGAVVHPRRWPRVREALAEDAHQHGRNFEAEYRLRVWAAAFEAVADFGEDADLKVLRGATEAALLRDVLGPDWRRKTPVPLTPEPQNTGFVEARDELRRILSAAQLTEHQAALAREVAQGVPLAEAARERGMSPGAARELWRRSRKKFAEARDALRSPATDTGRNRSAMGGQR